MSIKETLKNKLKDNSQKHAKWSEENDMVHCPLCGQIPLMGIVNLPPLAGRASRRNSRLQIQSKNEKCIPTAVNAAYATSTAAHIGYIS